MKWWVQNHFRILPTDERYKSLTTEQIELAYRHYLIDNPDLEKSEEHYHDPDYEEKERSLSLDDRKSQADEDPVLDPLPEPESCRI